MDRDPTFRKQKSRQMLAVTGPRPGSKSTQPIIRCFDDKCILKHWQILCLQEVSSFKFIKWAILIKDKPNNYHVRLHKSFSVICPSSHPFNNWCQLWSSSKRQYLEFRHAVGLERLISVCLQGINVRTHQLSQTNKQTFPIFFSWSHAISEVHYNCVSITVENPHTGMQNMPGNILFAKSSISQKCFYSRILTFFCWFTYGIYKTAMETTFSHLQFTWCHFHMSHGTKCIQDISETATKMAWHIWTWFLTSVAMFLKLLQKCDVALHNIRQWKSRNDDVEFYQNFKISL